ncbi:MAG: tetratricopeptide repeat protein [Calditrichaeota bacterium]|nr:tetratricopeptide repeat protein [Calditrichota bacterium]
MKRVIHYGIVFCIFAMMAPDLAAQTNSLEPFFKYFFNNQYDSARAEIKRQIAADSSAASLYFYQGKTCLAMHDYDAALHAFRQAVRKGYPAAKAFRYIGQIFEEQGRLADAIDAYRAAQNLSPKLPSLSLKMASLYFKRKNYRATIALGRQILKQDTTQMQAFYLIGRSHLQRAENDSALAIAIRAVSLDSNSVPNLLNLGVALFRKEKFDSSTTVLQRILEISPRSDEAKFYLAKNLAEQDDLVAAVRHLEDCVRLGGVYRLKAMKLLAQYFYEMKQLDESMKWARKYLGEKPEEGVIHYYLARALSDRGESDEAEKEFDKARRFAGEDFVKMIYFYRGLNFYQNGSDGKAIPWYKKAIAIDPKFSYAYYNLALVYDRYYEDKNPAIRYYEKFIELAKKDETVPPMIIAAAKERVGQLREKRFFRK